MGKTKVLLVDDDGIFTKNLGDYLGIMGYEVTKVGTGGTALELIEKNKPDILLVDLKLPDMDGSTILKKAKEISPKSVLFVVSAYVDPETEERVKRLGARSLIYKPVMFDDVIALFERANK